MSGIEKNKNRISKVLVTMRNKTEKTKPMTSGPTMVMIKSFDSSKPTSFIEKQTKESIIKNAKAGTANTVRKRVLIII